MNKVKVIAIFDIGKTNKKILLFDERFNTVYKKEEVFPVTVDKDDFECDDIDLLENWIKSTLSSLVAESKWNIKAVNFSTYGASLAFLDVAGNRLTPLYNYLKNVSPDIQNDLFSKYGGEEELKRDCLLFFNIDRKPVKSSRLFLGHIHDVNTRRLASYFGEEADAFKKVKIKNALLKKYLSDSHQGKFFFNDGMPEDYVDDRVNLKQFSDFAEAYHRLVFDLALLNSGSIDLIRTDDIKVLYISGGFARNEIFTRSLAGLYPSLKVYTSEIDNASALGAAVVMSDPLFQDYTGPALNLGLNKIEPWSL